MRTTSEPVFESCDVLVIGGGPAGTTAATLLRDRGWRVVLLEKDHHPRFHIGESLLPMNLPILERLGVLDRVRDIGVVKYGAEFATPAAGQTIYFAEAMDKSHPYAFQVRRSEFDHLLFNHSAERGVTVREGMKVTEVNVRPGGGARVRAVAEDGRVWGWEARLVVDASGRDTFLARQFGCKHKNPRHQSAAIFGHFRNAVRRPGRDAGNIGLYWFPHGWFWMIPLRDGIMSVGAVCWPEYLKTRRCSPAQFLWQTIALCPPVQERMQGAELVGEARATGNYSYRSTRMFGDGYLLVGDAYAFVDPVFSTGVYFAMNGATLAAEAADAYLRDPSSARPQFEHFQRQVNRGIDTISWFIYRFTTPAMQELFMKPREVLRIKAAIVSMLAGDVFRNTPLGFPLAVFKGVYYLTSAAMLAPSRASYRRRRRNAGLVFDGETTELS